MTNVKFSIYGDNVSPLENPEFLLEEFMRQSSFVQVERLTWDEAWPKLLGYALFGGGPHISQIGSIWTSTLMSMNVLRPFSADEIQFLAGQDAFYPSLWQDAMLTDQSSAWAIPFNAFTYLILYRRDLLERARVDEKTAFSTPQAMLETLKKLKAAGIQSPLVMPSGAPYRSRIHVLASWVWGAGGDFISADGRKILFAEPEALNGLEQFFQLYRHMDPQDNNLTYQKCGVAFATGDAAVTILGSSASSALNPWGTQQVIENLGVAVPPGIPWVGGANLVIWKETLLQMESEKAALALAQFLSTCSSQVKLAEASSVVPSRRDALEQLVYKYAPLKPAIQQALVSGRSYNAVPLWVRTMSELRHVFDAITADVISSPSRNVKEILALHLVPLADRFSLMLSK
ncbi:MAG: extracellular solute-binding protein [Chloroflexota bacterium]